jgi:hypothetical protein
LIPKVKGICVIANSLEFSDGIFKRLEMIDDN